MENRSYMVKQVFSPQPRGIHVTVGLMFALHSLHCLLLKMRNMICWLCVLYWKLILPVDLGPLLEFPSAELLIIWLLLIPERILT